MAKFHQLPTKVFRLIKKPPQLAYALGLGPLIGRLILLLTTTGRVTGVPRVTPLQYEQVDGVYYVGSSRGLKADWVKNIQADPKVEIRVKNQHFRGRAEVVTEPSRVAAFLEIRLGNHPRMVGAMLKADGIPSNPTRVQLEAYGAQIILVCIYPEGLDAPRDLPEST
jgi:deazaflavin-dependent oxidoreductase (nitroreductase family)